MGLNSTHTCTACCCAAAPMCIARLHARTCVPSLISRQWPSPWHASQVQGWYHEKVLNRTADSKPRRPASPAGARSGHSQPRGSRRGGSSAARPPAPIASAERHTPYQPPSIHPSIHPCTHAGCICAARRCLGACALLCWHPLPRLPLCCCPQALLEAELTRRPPSLGVPARLQLPCSVASCSPAPSVCFYPTATSVAALSAATLPNASCEQGQRATGGDRRWHRHSGVTFSTLAVCPGFTHCRSRSHRSQLNTTAAPHSQPRLHAARHHYRLSCTCLEQMRAALAAPWCHTQSAQKKSPQYQLLPTQQPNPPVMYAPSSLHRKAAVAAMSAGLPSRPSIVLPAGRGVGRRR